jgi:flagellar basal body-associated protein FliL
MAGSKSNQKYIIIAVGLALAAAGYFGYKSMLTSPDINLVAPPEKPTTTIKPTTKPTTKPSPASTTKPPSTTKQPEPTARSTPISKPKYTTAPNIQQKP